MAADDPVPSPDADLVGALGDLGRRIEVARTDAERRGNAPPPRRFPVAWLAVALLIALVSGGLVLAGGGDGDDELAAGSDPTTTVALPATAGDDPAALGAGATTTAAPTTTEAPATTAAPATTEAPTTEAPTTAAPTTVAPTTTAAPSTTAAPTTTLAPSTTAPAGPAPAAPAATPPPTADGPDQTDTAAEVTVVPGDSFWRIAERQVAEQLGQPPTVTQVTAYWAQLLDLNADRLVQPGNADLILPGQVLVLPGSG